MLPVNAEDVARHQQARGGERIGANAREGQARNGQEGLAGRRRVGTFAECSAKRLIGDGNGFGRPSHTTKRQSYRPSVKVTGGQPNQ